MNSLGFATLLVYVFCFLWRPQDYISFMLNAPILFFLQMLTLVLWFFGRKTVAAPQYKYLLGLLFAISVSSVLALGVSLGFDKAKEFFLLQFLIFLLIANGVTTVKRQQLLYVAFILGTLIMALHSVDQVFDPDKIGWTGMQMLKRNDVAEGEELWQPRYIGLFSDPNDLGLMLVAAIPFIVYLYFQASNVILKGIIGLCLLVHLYAIYLMNSRGTLLGVIAMLGIWGVLRYGGFKLLLRVVLISPLVPIVVPSRFYMSGDDSSNERIDAWYQGTQMFLSNPLFGVGKDGFLDYHSLTAHNSWVLVFAELGYVGYYCWVGFIFSSLYFAWVCQRDFVETGLPKAQEKAYNAEALLAKATMYSIIGAMVCAFFISRSYIAVLYILPAIAVSQYHRFQTQFKHVKFLPMAKNMFFLSLAFFVVINLIIRFNS
jgi:putative inorganic carbon (hco3(-)) transporter